MASGKSKRVSTGTDSLQIAKERFPNSQGTRYDPDNFSSDLRAANAARGLKWTIDRFVVQQQINKVQLR